MEENLKNTRWLSQAFFQRKAPLYSNGMNYLTLGVSIAIGLGFFIYYSTESIGLTLLIILIVVWHIYRQIITQLDIKSWIRKIDVNNENVMFTTGFSNEVTSFKFNEINSVIINADHFFYRFDKSLRTVGPDDTEPVNDGKNLIDIDMTKITLELKSGKRNTIKLLSPNGSLKFFPAIGTERQKMIEALAGILTSKNIKVEKVKSFL